MEIDPPVGNRDPDAHFKVGLSLYLHFKLKKNEVPFFGD